MSLDLIRAAEHVRQHQGKTFVVKVGGACLSKPRHVRRIAEQLACVHALGARHHDAHACAVRPGRRVPRRAAAQQGTTRSIPTWTGKAGGLPTTFPVPRPFTRLSSDPLTPMPG